MATNLRDEASTKPQKKSYPRKLTDKRREQNRQAQKSYRERQKRRIEELEKKVEEKGVALPSTEATTSYGSSVEDSNASTATVPNITFEPFEIGEEVPGPSFGDFELDIRGGGELGTMNETPQSFGYDESALLSSSLEENLTGLWPSPPLSEPMDAMLGMGESSASATGALVPSPAYSGPASPARASTDPAFLNNHLTMSAENCLSAVFEIAASIGITRESYVNDHQSPFYRSAIVNATCASVDAVARIEADSYRYLHPDLRPSTTQVVFPHFSYLDCIIWPRFRERALRAAIEGKLDHYELFMDCIDGGIVCWGNQQNQKGKGMNRGIACDQRSWEARPWFIKKWGWLVGGEDEEVIRGSRWWRFMRGEKE
ncbi:MAG: hypothetical protein Q9160_001453 [Pyrenula sp. 1 TL-2023]